MNSKIEIDLAKEDVGVVRHLNGTEEGGGGGRNTRMLLSEREKTGVMKRAACC